MSRIISKLPLNISYKELENNPNFSALLTNLSEHITKDGCSVQSFKDLKQSEEELLHQKHSWLLNKIIYDELQEILMDTDISKVEKTASAKEHHFYAYLRTLLNSAEAECYLNFSTDCSSKETLLGIESDDLGLDQLISSKSNRMVYEHLAAMIEERLKNECVGLFELYQPCLQSNEESPVSFDKAISLPTKVKEDKDMLSKHRDSLREDVIQRDKQFQLYYNSLLDSLFLLEKLIQEFLLGTSSNDNQIKSQWLLQACDAVYFKMKLLELNVLYDTYTKEASRALRKIKGYMNDELRSRDKEKERLAHLLDSYESVGCDFQSIVEEYSSLTKQLENKKWALNEMKSLMSKEDA